MDLNKKEKRVRLLNLLDTIKENVKNNIYDVNDLENIYSQLAKYNYPLYREAVDIYFLLWHIGNVFEENNSLRSNE